MSYYEIIMSQYSRRWTSPYVEKMLWSSCRRDNVNTCMVNDLFTVPIRKDVG